MTDNTGARLLDYLQDYSYGSAKFDHPNFVEAFPDRFEPDAHWDVVIKRDLTVWISQTRTVLDGAVEIENTQVMKIGTISQNGIEAKIRELALGLI